MNNKANEKGDASTSSPKEQAANPGNAFHSPTGAPPQRVQSSNSLFGEDIVNSGRASTHSGGISDDEHTTPPSIAAPHKLSPPPLIQTGEPLQTNAQISSSSAHFNPLPLPPAGRPPRGPQNTSYAPLASGNNATRTQSTHHRDRSTGDYSFMSALTDQSDDDEVVLTKPNVIARHDRTVSWDANLFDVSPSVDKRAAVIEPPPSILQPILSDEGQPPTSIRTAPPHTEEKISLADIVSPISLADVINPIESEAESAILQAIEARERGLSTKMQSQRAVFPQVPDNVIENIQEHFEKETINDEYSGSLKSPTSAKSPTSPKSPVDSAEGKSSDGNRRGTTSSNTTSPSKRSIMKRTSTKSMRMSVKSLGGRKTSTASKSSDNSKSGHEASPGSGAGVESALFGLATVMRHLHENSNEQHGTLLDHKEVDDHVQATDDIGHPTATFGEKPKNQTDALVANAAMLFRSNLHKRSASKANSDAFDPKKNDDMIVEEGSDSEESDIELGLELNEPKPASNRTRRRKTMAQKVYESITRSTKEEWDELNEFISENKPSIFSYCRKVVFYLFLPVLGASAMLYYLQDRNRPITLENDAYLSWFLIFVGIRQVITFTLAKVTEILLIDFLALRTRILIQLFGPVVTLMIVQSKGWPCTMTWWGVFDLCLLSGGSRFANHWLYYQSFMPLFNEDNFAGNVTASKWNYRILIAAVCVGIVTGVKRFVVGLRLGGRTYQNYGSKLAKIIHKMIIISQVAGLARKIQKREDEEDMSGSYRHNGLTQIGDDSMYNWDFRGFSDVDVVHEGDDDADGDVRERMTSTDDVKIDASSQSLLTPNGRHEASKSLTQSEKFRVAQLLEAWEEPPDEKDVVRTLKYQSSGTEMYQLTRYSQDNVSIQAILQFKQTLAFMDLKYPFSAAFGICDKRDNCIKSAQEIFACLLHGNLDHQALDVTDTLQFETLSELARKQDGELDDGRVKDLVRVFRPDREGKLSLVDFLRSVDQVYKDLRLLRASIANSSQIDQAFEAIINVAFYFVVGCVVLAAWGINPLTLFLSLSSVIVAFSFAVGSASAKYFEGIMFILGRTPYDIGDRISVEGPNDAPGADGVFTWFVENVTLYYTTLRLGATNEVATIANSNLASSRIVNAARSPKAVVYVNLKFGIDTPYAKLQLFKSTVESFIKARPREWLSCGAIRAVQVMADLGYIQYVIVLQHRESWQQIGGILENKAAVMNFCLEVQKQLGITYVQPSTPVDLTMKNPEAFAMLSSSAARTTGMSDSSQGPSAARDRTQSQDLRNIAAMFAPHSPAS